MLLLLLVCNIYSFVLLIDTRRPLLLTTAQPFPPTPLGQCSSLENTSTQLLSQLPSRVVLLEISAEILKLNIQSTRFVAEPWTTSHGGQALAKRIRLSQGQSPHYSSCMQSTVRNLAVYRVESCVLSCHIGIAWKVPNVALVTIHRDFYLREFGNSFMLK
jgi:hypothetical protein